MSFVSKTISFTNLVRNTAFLANRVLARDKAAATVVIVRRRTGIWLWLAHGHGCGCCRDEGGARVQTVLVAILDVAVMDQALNVLLQNKRDEGALQKLITRHIQQIFRGGRKRRIKEIVIVKLDNFKALQDVWVGYEGEMHLRAIGLRLAMLVLTMAR